MEKQCKKCGVINDLSCFHRNKNSKDGHHSLCKSCATGVSNKWVKDNLKKVVENKKIRRLDTRKSLLESAQSRAKSRGVPIDITFEDIVVPDYCPILGIKMVKSTGKSKPNSPTLDRVIPELGYTKGNIQVISRKANMMKSDATYEELSKFAEWVNKFLKETNE